MTRHDKHQESIKHQDSIQRSCLGKASVLSISLLLAGGMLTGCGDDPPPAEPQTEEPMNQGPMSEDDAAQDMRGEEDL